MLNENIKEYANLQSEIENLKEKLDSLKEIIIEEMGNETKVVTSDGIIAQIIEKQTFKYTDEIGMISYLKKKGLHQFITEKINTTPMNNELKKGLTLTEDLKPMYNKVISHSLSVKNVN